MNHRTTAPGKEFAVMDAEVYPYTGSDRMEMDVFDFDGNMITLIMDFGTWAKCVAQGKIDTEYDF